MPHKDPEKRRAYAQQYYKAHKAEMGQQNKVYRKRHKTRLLRCGARWRAKNREHVRKLARNHYHKNKETIRQQSREAYQRRKVADPVRHRDKIKDQHLRMKYGITLKDFNVFRQKQKGKCALCHMPMLFAGRLSAMLAVVDHDHVTGTVRGLLHSKCNTMLGFAEESITLLGQAMLYLKKHQ